MQYTPPKGGLSLRDIAGQFLGMYHLNQLVGFFLVASTGTIPDYGSDVRQTRILALAPGYKAMLTNIFWTYGMRFWSNTFSMTSNKMNSLIQDSAPLFMFQSDQSGFVIGSANHQLIAKSDAAMAAWLTSAGVMTLTLGSVVRRPFRPFKTRVFSTLGV